MCACGHHRHSTRTNAARKRPLSDTTVRLAPAVIAMRRPLVFECMRRRSPPRRRGGRQRPGRRRTWRETGCSRHPVARHPAVFEIYMKRDIYVRYVTPWFTKKRFFSGTSFHSESQRTQPRRREGRQRPGRRQIWRETECSRHRPARHPAVFEICMKRDTRYKALSMSFTRNHFMFQSY